MGLRDVTGARGREGERERRLRRAGGVEGWRGGGVEGLGEVERVGEVGGLEG